MIVLIETSTDICSVAIADAKGILAIRETPRSYSHSEVIAVFLKECIDELGIAMEALKAVAVSHGPGSYTALRIGTATGKGMCYALDIPMISVGTLDALATTLVDTVKSGELIIPMIDARRKEVYHTVYNSDLEIVAPLEPIILDDKTYHSYADVSKIHILGDGATKAKDILDLPQAEYHDIECSAKHMHSIAFRKFSEKTFEDIAYYEPLYYKGANITVQKKNILR